METINYAQKKRNAKLKKTKPTDVAVVTDFSWIGLDGRVRDRALRALRRFNVRQRYVLISDFGFINNTALTENMFKEKYSQDKLDETVTNDLYWYFRGGLTGTLGNCANLIPISPEVNSKTSLEHVDIKYVITKDVPSALVRVIVIQWIGKISEDVDGFESLIQNFVRANIFDPTLLSSLYHVLYDYTYYLDASCPLVSRCISAKSLPDLLWEEGSYQFGGLYIIAMSDRAQHAPTFQFDAGYLLKTMPE